MSVLISIYTNHTKSCRMLTFHHFLSPTMYASMYSYCLCFQCFFCEECGLWDLVLDTLSESDGSLSLSVNTEYVSIKFKEQSLDVGGM